VSERKGQSGGPKGSGSKAASKKPEAGSKKPTAAPKADAAKGGAKPAPKAEAKPAPKAEPAPAARADAAKAASAPAPKATAAKAASADGAAEAVRKAFKRTLVGRVKSDKMDKTVVVEVVRSKMDPVYKKYVRVRKSYKAHDEDNSYKVGDRVEIIEHRPLSKLKRWKVINLVERAVQE
jgi:small subunit ribosomal protein S17